MNAEKRKKVKRLEIASKKDNQRYQLLTKDIVKGHSPVLTTMRYTFGIDPVVGAINAAMTVVIVNKCLIREKGEGKASFNFIV